MNSSGLVTPPGNDGHGGGCLHRVLPAPDSLPLPKDQNIYIGGLTDNGTYNAASWKECCGGNSVQLASSCYPWCIIPSQVTKDNDEDEVLFAMNSCVKNWSISGVLLNEAHSQRPLGLTQLVAIGLVLAAMAM